MKNDLSKIKIAIISPSVPLVGGSGGITAAHYNLYCAIKELGFNTKILTFLDNCKIKKISEEGIKLFGPSKLFKNFIRVFIIFFRFFFFRGGKAYQLQDILLSQSGSFKISISLQKYKPDIIIVPDQGSPLFLIKKPKNSKIVFISHHNPLRFINEPLLGLHSVKDAKLAHKIECRTLKKVDAVICPSNYMKKFFLKTCRFNGSIEVIPNIIFEKTIEKITPFDLRKKLELPADAIIIYIPSAGSIYKGSNYVFEIIRRLSVVLTGKVAFYLSGEINELLKRELSFLGSDTVVFTQGQVNYFDNIAYMRACSFCISPTLIENFGMAILEANFCGLPVITFNVGGNEDIIKNGHNGFLVDLLDMENFIDKAQQLLANNELLRQMRNNSNEYALNNFSSSVIIEHYKKYIEQLLFHTL